MEKQEILKYNDGKKIIVTLKDGKSYMGVMDPFALETYNSFLLGNIAIYYNDVRKIKHKGDKIALECFDKNIFGKNVDVLLNNGRRISGEFTDDFEDSKEILVGDTMIKYKDIAAINEIVPYPFYDLIYEEMDNKPHKNPKGEYLYVKISFFDSSKEYSYISNHYGIEIGDRVIVDASDHNLEGEVVEKRYYKESEVPYPLYKTKLIKRVYR